MPINFDLLSRICKAPGTSGYEQKIRELVINETRPLVDDIYTDHIGNVIAVKKGKSDKKLMITAHMDEIGFMVKYIDDKGFIKFNPLGGFDPKTLTSQRVIIHGKEDIVGVMGSKPIHLMTAEERGKKLSLDDFFIDTGKKTEEVKKLISVGDPITRIGDLMELGDCVNGKSLDNRIAVYILIEALKEMTETPPFDIYAVFCVQEEVGLRGSTVATLSIKPDFGINIDTTIAFDTPEAKAEEMVTKLGDGVAIKVMDSSVICDYRMVGFMKETAEKANLKWQTEVLTRGGTDTAAIQRMAMEGGAICGAISIPTRHIHQTVEMVNKEDVRGNIDLLKACISEIDNYNWDFV